MLPPHLKWRLTSQIQSNEFISFVDLRYLVDADPIEQAVYYLKLLIS